MGAEYYDVYVYDCLVINAVVCLSYIFLMWLLLTIPRCGQRTFRPLCPRAVISVFIL